MKRNSSLILAALALAGLMASSTIVRADDPPAPKTTPPPAASDSTPAPRLTPAQRQAQLIKDLNLTGEKADKFKAIMKEQQEKSAALRQDTSVTGADRRTKMKEITDSVTAKMKDLLDKDQFEKWQKATQQAQGRRGARGQGGAGAPAPAAPDAPKQP